MRGSVRCLFMDFSITMIRKSSKSEVRRLHAADDGLVGQECRQRKGLAKGRTNAMAPDCETNPISPSEPTFAEVAVQGSDDISYAILGPEFLIHCPASEVVDDETNPISPPGLDAIPMSARTEVRGGAKVKFSGQARCKLRGRRTPQGFETRSGP